MTSSKTYIVNDQATEINALDFTPRAAVEALFLYESFINHLADQPAHTHQSAGRLISYSYCFYMSLRASSNQWITGCRCSRFRWKPRFRRRQRWARQYLNSSHISIYVTSASCHPALCVKFFQVHKIPEAILADVEDIHRFSGKDGCYIREGHIWSLAAKRILFERKSRRLNWRWS